MSCPSAGQGITRDGLNAANPETDRRLAGVLAGAAPAALVAIATAAAYLPALRGAFLWNDADYVTQPPLRSIRGLGLIWTRLGATEQYYPLLHSAFWLQHRLWGDHALGYHLASLGFHAAAAILFACVVRRLLVRDGVVPPGFEWIAALLFAVHPVHVESVAWIAEEKNTLSILFYLAAALAYLRFDENRRARTYAAASLWFVLSLLCKTATVTLPAALLVVFWWKRGRLDARRDVRPLIPWLLVGAAAGIFTSWVERVYGGAEGGDFELSLPARVILAGRAVWFYLGHLFWPQRLTFIYPRWAIAADDPRQWLYPLSVVLVGIVLWALRRRSRGPLAAYLLFVGTLFPVLGFANLYGALYSRVWDHWQYLADLAPIALVAAGLGMAWRAWPRRRGGAAAGFAALIVALGALTWAHCRMFADNVALYQQTLALNPGAWMAHNNLALEWERTPGRDADAMREFEIALRQRPDSWLGHDDYGLLLARMPGRTEEAIGQFREAVRLNPRSAVAHLHLGRALAEDPATLPAAIQEYTEAIQLNPYLADAHVKRGEAFLRTSEPLQSAIGEFETALNLDPDDVEARIQLGIALLGEPGRLDDAIAELRKAVALQPDYPHAHFDLGYALARAPNRLPEAAAQFELAVRGDPDDANARFFLAAALASMNIRLDEARANLNEVLRLQPANRAARRMLQELPLAGGGR